MELFNPNLLYVIEIFSFYKISLCYWNVFLCERIVCYWNIFLTQTDCMQMEHLCMKNQIVFLKDFHYICFMSEISGWIVRE